MRNSIVESIFERLETTQPEPIPEPVQQPSEHELESNTEEESLSEVIDSKDFNSLKAKLMDDSGTQSLKEEEEEDIDETIRNTLAVDQTPFEIIEQEHRVGLNSEPLFHEPPIKQDTATSKQPNKTKKSTKTFST